MRNSSYHIMPTLLKLYTYFCHGLSFYNFQINFFHFFHDVKLDIKCYQCLYIGSTFCMQLLLQFYSVLFETFFFFFFWFDSLCPINNLSVIKGQVFLGWTSIKLGLMFLLKDTTQWRQWGSNRGPSVSRQPLYHWATALPKLGMSWSEDMNV